MLGLTPLGTIHTAVSLVAVAAGVMAFFRDKEILARSTLGKVYVVTTILTCLTGFGIFQHGGFGKPLVLGVITLLALLLRPWRAAGNCWAVHRPMWKPSATQRLFSFT